MLPDPRLVHALDKDAADYGARNGSVAKPLEHDRLDLRGRRIEDRVSNVVAGEDGPDLPAIRHQEALYIYSAGRRMMAKSHLTVLGIAATIVVGLSAINAAAQHWRPTA